MERESTHNVWANVGAVCSLTLASLATVALAVILLASKGEGNLMTSLLLVYALVMVYSVSLFKDTSAKPFGFVAQEISGMLARRAAAFSKEALIVASPESLLFLDFSGIDHLLESESIPVESVSASSPPQFIPGFIYIMRRSDGVYKFGEIY